MIMERIQFTVWDMMAKAAVPMSDADRFETAIVMAVSVVKKLQTIHEEADSFLHGDIHAANIAVKGYVGDIPTEDNFVLIDFGKAFFEKEFAHVVSDQTSVMWTPHCHLSHFNLEGSRFGYRDDVYKTLLSAAFLMNKGSQLSDYSHKLADRDDKGEGLKNFHKYEFIFDLPPIPGVDNTDIVQLAFPHMDPAKRALVRKGLGSALDAVRGIQAAADKPDYKFIIGELEGALASVRNENKASIRLHMM
jgi:hypothetical protein